MRFNETVRQKHESVDWENRISNKGGKRKREEKSIEHFVRKEKKKPSRQTINIPNKFKRNKN